MSRLLVTADVHGSYSTWLTLKEMLQPEDALVVAGDLFSTRYPNFGSTDFQPDVIKNELVDFAHPFHFVYGNCDKSTYTPGYDDQLTFHYNGIPIYLHHGHRKMKKMPFHSGIIIQGHSHVARLKQRGRLIFLNPGSLIAPRDGLFTYAVINENDIKLINIKTKEIQASVSLAFFHS